MKSSSASLSSSAAALLVDRFVSASSSNDIRESLQTIRDKLKLKTKGDDSFLPQDVWTDSETLEALLQVLSSASYKGLSVEEGPVLVAQIYRLLLQERQASILLKEPQPGRLLATLLDVIGDFQQTSYTRVLCLQVMTQICTLGPSIAQTQLLEVPNGLHRLAEVLQDSDASVRNEALLLGRIIATWPSCAKVWVFADVCDTVISLAVDEGGLTGANTVVADCLELLRNLLRHDISMSDLVWQSPVFARKISQLLDLRKGSDWVNPKPIAPSDDLDDILQSGTEKDVILIPMLTRKEEDLLRQVMVLLEGLLASETIRASVWTKHIPLSSLIWELALISPPPPGVKYVCAMPSASLQQLALEHVAEVWNSPVSMDRHNGLDRLLFIVCTGGAPEQFVDKLGLSQAALYVLRKTLPPEQAKEIIMHTLAPPMSQESTEQPPTCVQKLVNTVLENIKSTDDLERRKINLSGSLGAIGVFLRDSTSREMILKITLKYSLIDNILESLESQDDMIALNMIRFLCEWVVETPNVVQALLSSTQSTCLSMLLAKKSNTAIMTGLLLGMCMDYMIDDPEKNGGWTRESILNILQKGNGGVSGYLNQLESLKTQDLLWKASPLEWKGFLQWYSSQVLVVRRRVVQELTGNAEDSTDDEGEMNTTGSKSLQKLLSQQAQELEEMRNTLAGAQVTIANQEKHVIALQRRVASTPTQLDDILGELTEKNQDLESKVSELEKEIMLNNETFLAQLKGKEDEITDLQNELRVSKTREQDAIADQDMLRGEMEGLSSAYTNLEDEFNRSRAALPSAASELPQQGQQPQGEVSSQEHGSELDTARAEIVRLRLDARAADDWMQMAVQRMNDIGSQNLLLKQEVTTLEERLSHAGSVDVKIQYQVDQEREGRHALEATLASTVGVARQELEQERHRRESLETQLASVNAGASAADAALLQELEDLKKKRLVLESQLVSSQQDVTDTMHDLSKAKTERENLSRKMEDMEMDLTIAKAEATSLREANRQLEIQLKASGVEGEARKPDPLPTEEIDSLRRSVQSLQDQLIDRQTEMDAALFRERTVINQRDEIICELEAKVSLEKPLPSITDLSGDPSVKIRDDKISQLSSANEAAQEWMAKAVERQIILSEQVTALSDERDALKGELSDMQGTLSTMKQRHSEVEVTMEDHIQMVTDLAEKSAELQDAELELEELKAKLQFAEDEIFAQRSVSQASQSAAEEVRALKTKLLEREEYIQQLKFELSSLVNDVTSSSDNVSKLEQNLAEMREVVSQQEEKVALFDVLQGENLDALDRVAVLEAEVSQLSQDKALIQKLLDGTRDELQQKRHEISNSATEVESTKKAMSTELLNLKSSLSQREQDVFQLREDLLRSKSVQEDIELLKSELVSATDDNIRLKAELDFVKSDSVSVNERTAVFEQLQTELKNLQNSKQALEQSREASTSVLDKMRMDLSSQRQVNASLSEGIEVKNTEIVNLQDQLAELKSWSIITIQEIAELKIAQSDNTAQNQAKDEECHSLSIKVETFELENNLLTEVISSLEVEKVLLQNRLDSVNQEENSASLAELRDKLSMMETEIATMQSESEEVVEQWKYRVLELETGTNQLEEELENQQKEASDVIEQWSSQCLELDRKVTDSETSITQLRQANAELQSALGDALQNNKENLTTHLQLQRKDEEISSLLETHQKETESLEAVQAKIIKEMNHYKMATEALTQESIDLTKKVVEMEEINAASSKTWHTQINELNMMIQSNKDNANVSAEKCHKENIELEQQLEIVQKQHAVDRDCWQADHESLSCRIIALDELSESHHAVITALRKQIEDTNTECDSVRAKGEKRIAELLTEINGLQLILQHQQDEAKSAVERSEKHVTDLQERNKTLEKDTQSVKDELFRTIEALNSREEEICAQLEEAAQCNSSELQNHIDEIASQSKEVIEQWQKRVSELEATVLELEEQLETQQNEANEAISAWEENCSASAQSHTETKREITHLTENYTVALQLEIKRKDDILCSLVKGYKSKVLDFAEKSPTAIMDALNIAMLDTNQFLVQVVNEIANDREAHLDLIEELRTQVQHHEEQHDVLQRELILMNDVMVVKNESESELSTLRQQIDASQEELTIITSLLKNEQLIVASMEKNILELRIAEEANVEKHHEYNIGLIQTIKDELGASLAKQHDLDAELAKHQTALTDSLNSLVEREAKLEGAEIALSECESRFEALRSENSLLQEALQVEQQRFKETETKWKDEQIGHQSALSLKDEEYMELRKIVEQLEGELDGMNESFQAQITDEISERATEMATEALRQEMMALRKQLEGDQDELMKEKRARKVAHEDIRRLKADLAVLLRAEGTDSDSHERLRGLMMKATDDLHRKERKESEELRRSLERSMQDLSSARRSEKSASERASAVRLQASALEQEVIATKSDVAFLTQTMDEMRQAEAARIASFEYRVTALEDDRETLRRFHADELENLRNELSHVRMEKDRVFQALKESETTNVALLYTTTTKHEVSAGSTPATELAKLRGAHAQLLSAAAEEGSRTERRIREAVAANACSVEADVIVERELRFAAESALETMKNQLETLRHAQCSLPLKPSQEVDRLVSQLKHSKAETKKLAEQVATTHHEHEKSKAELQTTIDELTLKYRKAQTRAHKLEREGQFDSDVNAEASRLRLTQKFDSEDEHWLVARDSTIQEEKKEISGFSFSSSEAFDYIQQQKVAIHDERQMYQELLAEHDDLLALLAQQDLEKASLHSALVDAAGIDAVDAAIQEAKDNAVKQFGRYIQLV